MVVVAKVGGIVIIGALLPQECCVVVVATKKIKYEYINSYVDNIDDNKKKHIARKRHIIDKGYIGCGGSAANKLPSQLH